VAKRPKSPTGNVLFTITLALPQDLAERLTARAIREGKNIETLVTEILLAETDTALLTG
jgi:hypothetical protein